MEPVKEKYITVQTIAGRLNCTERYVYELIQDGKLKAVKIGARALRIPESSFDSFIAANLINPADYFATAESEPAVPEPIPAGAARSAWMSSK